VVVSEINKDLADVRAALEGLVAQATDKSSTRS